MGRALMSGLAGAVRRWRIVLLLWVVGLLFGLGFSLAAGRWLETALGASLASRTLLKDLNANVFVDLWMHHQESLSMLAVVAVVMIVVRLAFSICLNAGVAGTAYDPRSAVTLSEFWRRGLRLYPVFARLWVLAMTVTAAILAALAGAAVLLMRWLSESPSEMTYSYVLGGVALLASIGLILVVAVHDHARLYAARQDVGAARAYLWAFWFVLWGDLRAPWLALALLTIGVVFWLVYQGAATFLPATSGTGVFVSILWGEVLLQGRVLLRVAAFVAQAELQAEMPE